MMGKTNLLAKALLLDMGKPCAMDMHGKDKRRKNSDSEAYLWPIYIIGQTRTSREFCPIEMGLKHSFLNR